MAKAPAETRLLASLPNFEGAYLGEEVKSDKPYIVLGGTKRDSVQLFQELPSYLML